MKKFGHMRKRVFWSKLDFTRVKKPKCDHSPIYDMIANIVHKWTEETDATFKCSAFKIQTDLFDILMEAF